LKKTTNLAADDSGGQRRWPLTVGGSWWQRVAVAGREALETFGFE